MRGIGKLPCNLFHRRFEPLLSDRTPFLAFLSFLFLAVLQTRKRKVSSDSAPLPKKIDGGQIGEGKLVIKDISAC